MQSRTNFAGPSAGPQRSPGRSAPVCCCPASGNITQWSGQSRRRGVLCWVAVPRSLRFQRPLPNRAEGSQASCCSWASSADKGRPCSSTCTALKAEKHNHLARSIYFSIFLSIYLSIYLSVCRSISLSIYLSICLSICLSIYPSIRTCRYMLYASMYTYVHTYMHV